MTLKTSPVLLIDDTRVFLPEIKENVIVARSSQAALAVIDSHNHFSEIWMDFMLDGTDSLVEVLKGLRIRHQNKNLPKVDSFYYHSSADTADELIFMWLKLIGVDGTKVTRIWDREQYFKLEGN